MVYFINRHISKIDISPPKDTLALLPPNDSTLEASKCRGQGLNQRQMEISPATPTFFLMEIGEQQKKKLLNLPSMRKEHKA
jgi:hypothetical protein